MTKPYAQNHLIKSVKLGSLTRFNSLPFFPASAVKLLKERKETVSAFFSAAHVRGQKTSLINSVCHECTQTLVLRCSSLISIGAVDTCP